MKYYPNQFHLFDDDFFDRFFAAPKAKMACDIKETETGYELALNIPGADKKDISLTLQDGYLQIQAATSISDQQKDGDGHWLRQERYHGIYQRSFYVGRQMSENDIHAAYQDGVLMITLPKLEKETTIRPKMISID